jgi:hypothetical protein
VTPSHSVDAATENRYEVRLFESGDREGYLALYDEVLGTASDAWFAWKYENNPYTDHVPIAVAEHDGRIVGAKSNFGLRVRWGDQTGRALQPCDTMVHPDHRREGLYSRMTELVKEAYADREPLLFFNFPNPKTLSGSLKHGWDRVGRVPVAYRIQRPVAAAGAAGGPAGAAADSLSGGLLGAYYDARERLASVPPDVTVSRHDEVPTDTLATLYERAVPDRLHTIRDRTYYDWRFGSPAWEYTAYTAHSGDRPEAAVVVGRRPDGGGAVHLTETLPLAGDGREGAYAAVLDRVVDDNDDAALLALAGEAVPRRVRRQFGFYPDTAPLVRRVAGRTVLVAYPLSEPMRDADERGDLTTLSNWAVTYTDMDTR